MSIFIMGSVEKARESGVRGGFCVKMYVQSVAGSPQGQDREDAGFRTGDGWFSYNPAVRLAQM